MRPDDPMDRSLPAGAGPAASADDATLASGEAETLAGRPAAPPATRVLPAAIGSYRIVGRLGEGGMGIVFDAEQEHPRRRVALKVIRGGMFVDEHHVKMFQREVDTLARLKHPNIAAIYEAGRTEAGEHFFAMELVRGRTLDAFLRARSGPIDGAEIRFRLRLFVSIAGAVNYAHQRGVIHRDLKPSNIVVADAEGPAAEVGASRTGEALPEVKILDFGLARITDTDVEAATAMSEIGVIKGTLPYMSPEQTRGNPDEIDLRSDVYALGVLLYEMLTGSRPYDTQKSSLIEAVRIISEVAPAPLSRTWVGSGRPDPDLQTIVNKALEKEAARRYGSAEALAGDVERYLDSRPILARAPSSTYQLAKFARRNRVLVAGVAATLLALVAGVIASTTFGLREAAQRRVAEQARKDTEAVAQFQADMLNGIDAEAMGRHMADDLLRRLAQAQHEREIPPATGGRQMAAFRAALGAINPTDAALQVIDRNILERAVTSVNAKFGAQPLVRAHLMRSIGGTYSTLGLMDKAEPPLLLARAIYDSLLGPRAELSLGATRDLAASYLIQGRSDEAEPLFRAGALRLPPAERLRDTLSLQSMNDLAVVYTDLGRFASAESLLALTLEAYQKLPVSNPRYLCSILNNYAWAFTQDGKFDQAIPLGRRAVAMGRQYLGNDSPETMTFVNDLAVAYARLGRRAEAEPLYREDFETSRRTLGEEHPGTLVAMANLGRFYLDGDQFAEAERILAKTLEISKRVQPPGFFGTGVTALSYGRALVGLGRFREAEAPLLLAHGILLKLTDPHDRGVQKSVSELVEVYVHTGRADRAAAWRAKLDPVR